MKNRGYDMSGTNHNYMLKINSNPKVQVYAHHAFINAIVDETYEEDNHNLMNLTVMNAEQSTWCKIERDTEVTIEKNSFVMNKKTNESNTESFVYRECNIVDELVIEVKHLQVGRKNSIFNLILTGNDIEYCASKNSNVYRLGLNDQYVYSSLNDTFRLFKKVDMDEFDWYKLRVENNTVYSYMSKDGCEWISIDIVELPFEESKRFIGINTSNNMGIPEFKYQQIKDWFAMNYIQLYYTKDSNESMVHVDYRMFASRRFRLDSTYASHFVDTNFVPPNEAIETHSNIPSFIQWCLQHKYYVAVHLDEYYIPERLNYQRKHFKHYNLIYGYNASTKEYHILGYKVRLVDSKVSQEQLDEAITNECDYITYKLIKNKDEYSFDLEYFIQSLEDYVYSRNTSKRFANIEMKSLGIYGIDIIKDLCTNPDSLKLLIEDDCISYIIFEHCKLMMQRFDYLENISLLGDSVTELREKCNHMYSCSVILKNLIVKYRLIGSLELEIIECTRDLYQAEADFYISLIEQLKKSHA